MDLRVSTEFRPTPDTANGFYVSNITEESEEKDDISRRTS